MCNKKKKYIERCYMDCSSKTFSSKAGQGGFILVMALVMLAVLTLIGVSSMNSSNMELKATANAQQHQDAFNAVQSLLEFAISDQGTTPVVDFQTSDANLTQTLTTTVINSSALTATVNLSGCSIGLGTSLEEGKGFSYNFFNILGSGSNSTGTATSVQGQGVRYPSASC
jgi:type IV pilus assembly protein PilX